MKNQLDLFTWAAAQPSNVIDLMPALIRKAALEAAYAIPARKGDGKVLTIGRAA